MPHHRGFLRSAWLTLSLLLAPFAFAQVVKTPHAEVELLAATTAVVPGQATRIGLSIKHAPHWHSYWKNPGDSGYPTKVVWHLPPGVRVSEFEWPAPKRLPTGPIVNFGYEGELLLPARLEVPAELKPGQRLEIRGKAEWLICKDVCIPEEGEVGLSLSVAAAGSSPAPSAHAARFAAAARAVPRPIDGWGQARVQVSGRELQLLFSGPPGAAALTAFDVFPEPEQITEPAVQSTYRTAQGYAVRLKLAEGAKLPAELPIVVTTPGGFSSQGESIPALRLLAPVETVANLSLPAGAVALASPATPASPPIPTAGARGADLGLWAALLLAFIGGAILNLMPCVFPVLSLKILSFAPHAGSGHTPESRLAMRKHGLYYAAGVVLSFLALAGVLLALKAAGSAIGWGFQLQNPGVVWVLAVIFFLIGLNLIGAFEVGQLAPSSLLSFTARHPGLDAFATGVLAVIAASPCTAPFMGAALGFALTQHAGTALAVFAALGLGMAAPYVLLAWFPRWLDRLPRPGPWMLTFKQLLAFPMFLTVVWLVWVLAQQAGVDGAAIALIGLVALGFAGWLLGSLRPGVRWSGLATAILAAVLAWPSESQAPETSPSAQADKSAPLWQPWSPETVASALASGRPVFVDYTAAWCVSCQANKRLVLSRQEVLQAFAAKNVLLLRADWTHRDARITESLRSMGRSGVPVYVLQAPGKPAQLLPELLTVSTVLDSLSKL